MVVCFVVCQYGMLWCGNVVATGDLKICGCKYWGFKEVWEVNTKGISSHSFCPPMLDKKQQLKTSEK